MNKEQIMDLMTKRDKLTLVTMKREAEKLNKLLESYLTRLPDFHINMGSMSPVEWKCSRWLELLILRASMPCHHCCHAGSCKGDCLSAYMDFFDSLCKICTETDREFCQPWAKDTITRRIKPQDKRNKGRKCNYPFLAFIKSESAPELHSMFAVFEIPDRVSTKKRGAQPSWDEVARKADEFLNDWGVKSNRRDPDPGRAHIEAVLTIISLQLAFFGDWVAGSVFNQMTSSIGHEDFCSEAAIGAFLLQRDGYSGDEIRRIVNSEYNPEEQLVGQKKSVHCMRFDSADIIGLMDGIQSLYNSRYIPEFKMKSIKTNWLGILDKWVEKDELTRYPIRVEESSVHLSPEFEHKHLLYIAYTRLAALVSVVPRLKLSAKSPRLFEGGRLQKLRNILLNQQRATKDRQVSNPYNLLKACKELGLSNSTVRDAIETYKEGNPAYGRLMDSGYDKNFLVRLVAESTENEIEQWIAKVAEVAL